MRRAVFLDRDGVINRALVRNGKPYSPKNCTEVEILPGVYDALMALSHASYLLIVVTNQPDVARLKVTKKAVDAINRHLAACLPIDEFKTCYHDERTLCPHRKPQPGALISAAKQHKIDLSNSYMIGDRWKDIVAGQTAGCRTIFVDYSYKEQQPSSCDYRVRSLLEAAQIILGEKK